MVRLIVYAAIFYLLYTVLKKFIPGAPAGGGSRSARNNDAGPGNDDGEGFAVEAEDTVQDPACGSFIIKKSAVSATKGNKIYHFCGEECRDKFLSGEVES